MIESRHKMLIIGETTADDILAREIIQENMGEKTRSFLVDDFGKNLI